ncbi:MAG: DUF202 domain-containing protein, partial [Planctomycetota bacterium]
MPITPTRWPKGLRRRRPPPAPRTDAAATTKGQGNRVSDEPQLRDTLAIQRTELANERTLLAYGRTAIMLVSTGAVVVRFASPAVAAWAA